MPKLLQINITANWGSTGKIAESIGIAAIKAGWESHIAYGRWCNSSQSHLIRIGGWWDKYFHYTEQRIRDNEGLCSRSATKRLIQRIDEIKPDIVQLHNIHDHYLNYRLLFEYLKVSDIKVVWTFHDCWAFTGHCFHFVTKDCMRWQRGCHECPMRNVLPKTLLDRSKNNYDLKKRLFLECKNLTIVPCSDWMSGFVRKSFLKDKRIEVIKNGVDLNVFKPLVRNDNLKKYNLLAVSSVWNKDKGLDDIFKLREKLSEKFIITIVGLSSMQMGQLPAGIAGIERTQNVQELVQLYSNADVLINPTYADTFPTVNLEALACGTPVITYETGGSPEAVSSETGWVVEQGDIDAMASIVRSFEQKEHSDIVAQRRACRDRAKKEFDKNECYEKYIKLYNTLIDYR